MAISYERVAHVEERSGPGGEGRGGEEKKVTGRVHLAAASPALPLRCEEGLEHGYLAPLMHRIP